MTDENLQAEVPAEAATPEPEKEQEAGPATAPEDAGESETEESSEDSEKPKPKGGFQKRISELTRNWRESERRVDQLMDYIAQMQKAGATPQQIEAATEQAPTLEQFGYDEAKYQQAVIKFAESAAERAATRKMTEWEQKQQSTTKAQSFKQREAEFKATVEDYEELVYDQSLSITTPMAEVIAESDIGPQVAYYLAKNPDEASRIAALSPIQTARELGKIEARLTTAKAAPKATTKAPPPPPKITATDTEVEPDPDKMSVNQWLKWREKQLKRKG